MRHIVDLSHFDKYTEKFLTNDVIETYYQKLQEWLPYHFPALLMKEPKNDTSELWFWWQPCIAVIERCDPNTNDSMIKNLFTLSHVSRSSLASITGIGSSNLSLDELLDKIVEGVDLGNEED